MGQKTVNIITSPELQASPSEVLKTDVLRVEAGTRVVVPANTTHKINLTVFNTSSTGRMASIVATFDASKVSVHIPIALIYVAPEGKTVVCAVVQMLVSSGHTNIQFSVT